MASGPVPIRPYMNGETPTTVSSTGTSEPESWRNGDEFTYWWPGLGYAIEAKHLRESSDGIQAELEIVSQVDGTIHWGRLNVLCTA